MYRYAAKLLFQFRVDVNGDPGRRRLCEERIIQFKCRSPREALRVARRRGAAATYSYPNSEGNTVSFEFVGVLDMIRLGPESDTDEVWYEIRERLLPMERRDHILPIEEDLLQRIGAKDRRGR